MAGNLLTENTPPDWEGCNHLDCLPECKPWEPHCHCERLERLIKAIESRKAIKIVSGA